MSFTKILLGFCVVSVLVLLAYLNMFDQNQEMFGDSSIEKNAKSQITDFRSSAYPAVFVEAQNGREGLSKSQYDKVLSNLARSVEGLSSTHPYKRQVLGFFVDLYTSDLEDSSLQTSIYNMLGNIDFLSVQLNQESLDSLYYLVDGSISNYRQDELYMIARFELEGYQGIIDRIVDERLSPLDNSVTDFEMGRDGVPGAIWYALLLKSTYDPAAIDLVLTIAESTEVNRRHAMFRDIAKYGNDRGIQYLVSYVFSDQRITRSSQGSSESYISWYAAKALALAYEDFPIGSRPNARRSTRQLEEVVLVRDWLRTQLDPDILSVIDILEVK